MITRRKDISTLQEVHKFIEDNYTRDILVDALCKEFGLNRTKLQAGFNQLYGTTVYAFVAGRRMDKARDMLTETDDSVKAIAIECGYRSASSFTRIFTRLNKRSPSQYRSLAIANAKHSDNFNGSDM